jgi:GTP pyrophosphokinase
MFHRSKCCYPLPGEEVVGFVTRGRGVSIHTFDCPNLETLTIDRDRLVDVEWAQNIDTNSTYSVRVSVVTIDQKGLLADLSAIISAYGININHIDANTTRNKQAHFNFILEVKNKSQLNDIMKKLSQINGVIEIKRIKTT